MKYRSLLYKTASFINSSLKSADLFKQQITLTYKGNTSFSTLFGGLVSVCILIAVSVYAAFLFDSMINRNNTNNTLSTEVVNLITNDENYYLSLI